MRSPFVIASSATLLLAAPLSARDPSAPPPPRASVALADVAGHYRAAEGPDLASELDLASDGSFAYVLAAGALDERATGHWRLDGNVIRLTTDPRPVPPAFAAAAASQSEAAPLALSVTWPNGNGIAGVDFVIGFDSGDPVSDYTQQDGWRSAPTETRTPRWIALTEPINRIASPRFPIDASKGNALHFVLIPNDLGVFDFSESEIEPTADGLLLRRPDGRLRFVRTGN